MFGRKYNKYILFVITALLMLTVECNALTNNLTQKTATENMTELLDMFSLFIFFTLGIIESLLLIINKEKLKHYELMRNTLIIVYICIFLLHQKILPINIIQQLILLILFIIISIKLIDKKELLKIFIISLAVASVVDCIYCVTNMGQLLNKIVSSKNSDYIIYITTIMLIPSIVNFIIIEINRKKILKYEMLKNIQLIVFICNFYLLMTSKEYMDGSFLIHDVFFNQKILIYMAIWLIYIIFDIMPIFLFTSVVLQIKKAKRREN